MAEIIDTSRARFRVSHWQWGRVPSDSESESPPGALRRELSGRELHSYLDVGPRACQLPRQLSGTLAAWVARRRPLRAATQ